MRAVVDMGTARLLAIMLMLYTLIMVILLARSTECQLHGMTMSLLPTQPHPLCVSQFALVNYACLSLPYTPGPHPTPPNPPSPPPDDDNHRIYHHHKHHHHHHHHHHHNSDPGPVEENCCRWLNEIDEQCVCDLLVHLPAFLAKPVHEYHVIVPRVCNVTYSCDGRLRP